MGGVEPPTSSLPRMRSNLLSYMGQGPVERETGLEPATPSLEGLCSSQLSYSRLDAISMRSRCDLDAISMRSALIRVLLRGCSVRLVERGGFEPPKA